MKGKKYRWTLRGAPAARGVKHSKQQIPGEESVMASIFDLEKARQRKSEKERNKSTFPALAWIRKLELPATDKALLYVLASRIDNNFEWSLTREQLAKEAGIKNIATVTKVTKRLEKLKYLEVKKLKFAGSQYQHNRYKLLVPAEYRTCKNDTQSHYVVAESHDVVTESNTNYPIPIPNYPLIDDPLEEDGGKETFPQHTTGGISGKESKGKTPDEKLEQFPITEKFQYSLNSKKASATAKVAFWCELLKKYRPSAYKPGDLPNNQIENLYKIFKRMDKPIHAKVLLEWTVSHWKDCTAGDSKAKPAPALDWINTNLEKCIDYYQETAPVKLVL